MPHPPLAIAACFAVAIALAVSAASARAAPTQDTIGTATAITTTVTAMNDTTPAALKKGDPVFANQTVSTDASGIGQFEFRDHTRLAIGPGSTVVLDDFVYDANRDGAKVVLNLTRGTFRFMTGRARHDAYEIHTPTATIGVRGTAFDLHVAPNGEVAVAMIDGAIEVCPRGGACRLHDVIGRFLHMTRDGIFSLHEKWDGKFFDGLPLRSALPFLNDQRLLVPSLRGQTRVVGLYLGGAADTVGKAATGIGKAVGDAGKTVGGTVKKIAPPKLKLRNLFK